ncbi:flagellin lysine-N-methylase [Clostridium perfringens]|uniref:FliB domain-containing protein n=1 Tax=Clostridium perfringens F262 TaxID=883064 RepID=A0AAV3FDS6_CLOPF|nr:flagellin lysine-N-methylase [Clostridium perfringens]EIA17610.1 fliB domain-containing protein [Clostridium perfringens F262]ELC8367014.1 flagellin lysine-N-methylase [Clostridium perfringens]MBO3343524.1 flagellin lysine-N-methylase [Clostridium perfringens]MBO3346596.1 flagellin lysine-N-methylase [Clostridium perfringens]MBO3349668.1 flagellin lysine-N-methylase [Clostridium perfringens]
MKVRVPNYFNEFKCIASECEDTCCAGWEIVIDDETHKRYENVEGEFGEILRSKIVKSDGENIFLLNNGNCSFLNEKKMCEIYINLGEDHLCYTCQQFPRYTEEFLDLKEVGLSLSCPEAARIILRKAENTTFNLSEEVNCENEIKEELEDDLSLSCENINSSNCDLCKSSNLKNSENNRLFNLSESENRECFDLKNSEDSECSNSEVESFTEDEDCFDEGIDEVVLSEFLECRNIVFNIIERNDLDLGTKAALALEFVKDVQNKIDLGDMNEIPELMEEYRDENFINTLIKELESFKGKEIIKHKNLCEYLKIYKSIKHINSNDPLGLGKALKYFEGNKEFYLRKHKEFNEYYKENLYKFKNILVYFIFRYFMKAIFDYDVSAKIKLGIISTLMIKELAVVRFIENNNEFTEEDMVEVSRIYSKDIEHSDENIENLQEIFETEEIFEVDEILPMLMNDF